VKKGRVKELPMGFNDDLLAVIKLINQLPRPLGRGLFRKIVKALA
jgi:hypothetical protein